MEYHLEYHQEIYICVSLKILNKFNDGDNLNLYSA